jgi:hypothetical protein
MAYRRREHDPACRCDRADTGCAALAVQPLSRSRVQELAEGASLAVGPMATPALGPELGWRLAVVAGLLAWWRLGFRPSASARFWRRQAVAQRQTAGALNQLEEAGWLGASRPGPPGLVGQSRPLGHPAARPPARPGHPPGRPAA